MNIPIMQSFMVAPKDTIESLKLGLPMSHPCNQNLTTPNFGMEASINTNLKGGFLSIDEDNPVEAGVEAVKELTRITGRNFRLGTPLEALAYVRSGSSYPHYWVVASKIFYNSYLSWFIWCNVPGFYLCGLLPNWPVKVRIFVVEEPG